MDNKYKIGALGDLIASEMKKKKRKTQIKNTNVESEFQSNTTINNLHEVDTINKNKKRKSLKNSNKLIVTKKKKIDKCSLNSNEIHNEEKTNNKKLIKYDHKNQITINSEHLISKKKKVKKNQLSTPQSEITTKNNVLVLNNDQNQITDDLKTVKQKKKKKEQRNQINSLNTSMDKKKINNTISQVIDKEIFLNNDSKLSVTSKKIKKSKQKKQNMNSEVNNESSSFENTIKKKKNSKDNSTIKTNVENETTKNKGSISKLTDIKNSADYIEKESRTVFVGNVPVNVKMSAVKSLFKQFGEIETMRLRSVAVKSLDVPKRVSIMKGDFHPQRDTANVYVRFKTIEQAKHALDLNATQFEGHTIRVDLALNTGHKQNKKKGIFIGNLPYSIQEDEIWDFFKDCGIISAVRIVRDNATGVSKGFGYVDFEAKESVELAIQLQGKKIQNREIRIKRIETKTNKTNVFNRKSIPFKRNKPISKSTQHFQGETMKSKLQKKKQKPTKTELMRKKIAKKLNA